MFQFQAAATPTDSGEEGGEGEMTAGIDALHSRRVVCDVRWHLANITMAPIRINAFPVHDVID